MPDQPPKRSKTPAQEAFEMLAWCWGALAVADFFGWQYKVPGLHWAVQEANEALSRYTLPWLERTFGHVSPILLLPFNLALIVSVSFRAVDDVDFDTRASLPSGPDSPGRAGREEDRDGSGEDPG